MTKFEGCYLTSGGLELVNNRGVKKLVFTKAVTGSGRYESQEDIKDFTQLKEQKQEFNIDKVSIDDNIVGITFRLNNSSLEQEYDLSEVGVYAKADDGDEQLYCMSYALQGNTEKIPVADDSQAYIMSIEISTVVSTDAEVTIALSVERQYVNDQINNAITPIQNRIDDMTSEEEIEEAFNEVYNFTTDLTAMDLSEINEAISTGWNGETSEDETAMSSDDVSNSISTEWNGETSVDEEAITATEINNITN